ncbi:MAG: hypothetical protein KDA54_09010 [Phycisphaerales bacterium]|nr:hypothetical protein [Phycisphaerales bacterium]
MANNVMLMYLDLTTDWVRLVDEPLVANFTLTSMSTGGFAMSGTHFEIRQGSDTTYWPLGVAFELSGVDLSTLEFRSTFEYVRLGAIGNTR